LHPSHKFAYSKVLKQIDQTKLDNSAKDKVRSDVWVDGKIQIRNAQDIEIFEKFVEHNGHCGGWNEHDHLLFLRLKSKYHKQNEAKFFSALLGQLPGKSAIFFVPCGKIIKKNADLTAEKIADHASWFDEYETLREKNRLAIQKWREARKMDRKKDALENNGRKSSASSSLSNDVSEQRKSDIAEWKVEIL
jgi:hypothetical protein